MQDLKVGQLKLVAGALSLSGAETIGAGGAIGGAVTASKIISSGAAISIADAGVAVAIGSAVFAGVTAAGVGGYAAGTAIYNNSESVRNGAESVMKFIFGDYGSGGSFGCVQIDSLLPEGGTAGEIKVGDVMQLSDEATLEPGSGTVSYSQRKKAPGFRITTKNGVTLVCSDSAPIPTPEGLVLAPNLLGKSVAVRLDKDGKTQTTWELVTAVDSVGEIEVQHITVGDKCFWAGEIANAFILHHNIKIQTTSYGEIIYNGVNLGYF
jgi:hypothetical protein